MTEKKKKFDEQTLARVLEAAYILQEHQNELEEFKSGLHLSRKEPAAEREPAATATSPSPVISPAPPVSPSPIVSVPEVSPPPIISAPEVSAEDVFAPEVVPPKVSAPSVSVPTVSAPPASIAPIASPAPPASSPVRILEVAPAKEVVSAKSGELILAEVLDTQRQILSQNLELDAAMALVAGQVIEICGAAGAAIGIVNRRTVSYRSVAGIRALPVGSEVSFDEALCAPCLQNGEVWRCADTNSEYLPQRKECRHRGIGSMIAAPLFHEGRTVGALELLFSDADAFTELDVQACQLMAGIITESLSRDSGLRGKDAPAANTAPMADTVLVEEPAKEQVAGATESYQCKCGHMLLAGEQFCGECGTPRAGDYEPASMQSKVASLWHMQEASKPEPPAHAQFDELPPTPSPDASPVRLRTSILIPPNRSKRATVPHFGLHDAETNKGEEPPQAAASLEPTEPKAPSEIDAPAARTNKALEELISPPTPVRADWSSATSARDFLEQVADGTPQNVLLRLWNTHRGDIYLAIAVILVLCVIRWGMWSSHPSSPQPSPAPAAPAAPASSVPHKAAEPDLPLSERMLIAMGLAEAPEPPADKGNPSTQVWVDLHTALYYCPGADLYGKTATGKYTTQREAELDQFQPAYRKTCN